MNLPPVPILLPGAPFAPLQTSLRPPSAFLLPALCSLLTPCLHLEPPPSCPSKSSHPCGPLCLSGFSSRVGASLTQGGLQHLPRFSCTEKRSIARQFPPQGVTWAWWLKSCRLPWAHADCCGPTRHVVSKPRPEARGSWSCWACPLPWAERGSSQESGPLLPVLREGQPVTAGCACPCHRGCQRRTAQVVEGTSCHLESSGTPQPPSPGVPAGWGLSSASGSAEEAPVPLRGDFEGLRAGPGSSQSAQAPRARALQTHSPIY